MTIGAMAQGQYFYEWKDGKYIQRSLSEVDSITFSLPESPEKEYKYVDLGLPSGTLWADRNVGADSPEAYGDYFAWGEIATKSTYNCSTYKWCRGDYNTMTKYCTDSNYGTVDNNTVLDLEDDAAYVNMGPEWRMPTYDELNELRNYCTWVWTNQNGTNGWKVTGPNGNSIFLPAAGFRNNSDLYLAGIIGDCWSSSLCESGSNHAWCLYFKSGNHSTNCRSRDIGYTVRAVVSTVNEEPAPVVNKVDLGLPSGTLWADRNVGADSPEAYGDYFAWGETTTKSIYNLSTYKWCRGSEPVFFPGKFHGQRSLGSYSPWGCKGLDQTKHMAHTYNLFTEFDTHLYLQGLILIFWFPLRSVQSVQLLSCVQLFAAPKITARQASMSITNSRSSLKLMSIELVMPSSHLILCHSLLLPPSIFPNIKVFSNESVLHIRWPKC